MISSIIENHLKDVNYLLAHGYSNDYLILKKYGLDLEKEDKLKIDFYTAYVKLVKDKYKIFTPKKICKMDMIVIQMSLYIH